MKTTSKIIIFIFALLALAGSVYAETPREQLQQMVEQLQQSPSDNALRERIIKQAQELKPAPTIPPEAKRPFVMAGTYQKEAKKPSDFVMAIDAYQEALKVAPWWGDAYFNLSISLESAGRLDEAKAALNLYLLTKPNDIEEAQNRLYALDAKKNLAAKQSTEAANESAKANKKAKTLIVPGVGIGEIKLGMSESQVIAILGAPLKIHRMEDTVIITDSILSVALSRSVGGKVKLVDSMHRDFVTSEGIGVGSSKAEISATMGPPSYREIHKEDHDGREWAWQYSLRGVIFFFLNSPSEVSIVRVQEPW